MDAPHNKNLKFNLIRCAKEKLKEDRRFIIERKNSTKCFDKKKSKKVFLKDSLMNFEDDTLEFENIDIENEYLDVAMAIGTDKQGKFFKPTSIFRFKSLIQNEETKEVWNLAYGSFVKVVYKFLGCKEKEEIFASGLIRRKSSKSLNNFTLNNPMPSIEIGSPVNENKDRIEFYDPRKKNSNIKDEIEKLHKKLNTSCFVVNPDKDEVESSNLFNQSFINENKDASRIKNLVGFYETVNNKRNSKDTRDRVSTIMTKDLNKNSSARQSVTDNNSNYGTLSDCLNYDKANIYSELTKYSAEEKIKEKDRESIGSKNKEKIPATESEIIKVDEPIKKKSSKKLEPNFAKSVSNMIDKNDITVEIESDKSDSKLIILNPIECEIPEKEKHIPDSFCDGFFIAGLKQNNSLAVENSEDYISPCCHENCSMLPAYKPEILFRYPVKDSNRLELTNLTATLCFPVGVKLCYSLDESDIKTVKNYSTTIVNQDGLRYHMMTYHYYVKLDNSTFHNTYDINPLKEFMNFEQIAQNYHNNPELKEKYEIKLEKQLEVCTSFNFNDYIYLPFCASLISKFPFTKQMENALQTIIQIAVDENKTEAEIYKLLLHLVREVPIPINDKKLHFYLPGNYNKLEITNSIYFDLPVWTSNVKLLLHLFSIENIISIINLMLMEQKILFVHDKYNELSEIIDAFVSLLYPLVWEHTYIPILSCEMIKYLESFMPFVMGMHECLLQNARSFLDQYDDIYIIYIKKNLIDTTANKKGKKLKKKELILSPELPAEIEEEISKELKNVKTFIDKNSHANGSQLIKYLDDEINFRIRNIFCRSFVVMLEDYQNYQVLIDGIAYFNTEGFLKRKPEKNADFYSELFETLLFRQFLQAEVKEAFPYFFKKMNQMKEDSVMNSKTTHKRSNSIKSKMSNQSTASSKRSSLARENLKNICPLDLNELNQFDLASLSSFYTTEIQKSSEKKEKFLVYPYFIKEQVEIKMFADQPPEAIFGPSEYISEIYPENKRILSVFKNFKFDEVPKNYNRYIIPELKEKDLSVCQLVKKSSFINVNLSSSVKFISNLYEEKIKKQNFVKKETFNQYALRRRQTYLKDGSTKDYKSLTTFNQEKIKEYVNDYMILLFTSKKLEDEQLTNLELIFEYPNGRKYLCESLFLPKFKDLNFKLHYLGNDSYDSMFMIIDRGLKYLSSINSNINIEVFENAILLIKCSFHYYKDKKNGDPYTIFEALLSNIDSYLIWYKPELWLNWVKKEISEKADNRKKDDGFYFAILVDVTNIMFKLNMKYEFIEKTIITDVSTKYIKEKKVVNSLSEYVKNCQKK